VSEEAGGAHAAGREVLTAMASTRRSSREKSLLSDVDQAVSHWSAIQRDLAMTGEPTLD
jgi:hypothetical protein